MTVTLQRQPTTERATRKQQSSTPDARTSQERLSRPVHDQVHHLQNVGSVGQKTEDVDSGCLERILDDLDMMG
jgi:hypothetical protein